MFFLVSAFLEVELKIRFRYLRVDKKKCTAHTIIHIKTNKPMMRRGIQLNPSCIYFFALIDQMRIHLMILIYITYYNILDPGF